jgi:hypothetical protein
LLLGPAELLRALDAGEINIRGDWDLFREKGYSIPEQAEHP